MGYNRTTREVRELEWGASLLEASSFCIGEITKAIVMEEPPDRSRHLSFARFVPLR
jgi:hypothetical protein